MKVLTQQIEDCDDVNLKQVHEQAQLNILSLQKLCACRLSYTLPNLCAASWYLWTERIPI